MGSLGFGSYRISIKSKEHESALVLALKSGIKLIDTSSNYTNGESEELIGKVLKENPEYRPIIVTKAGYIQGPNLKDYATEEDIVEISESLKHSMHPSILEQQLTKSLARMGLSSVDVLLIHNPEYYFELENSTNDIFYSRIKKAFIYLEKEVENGRIKSYGISSNNFVLPHNKSGFVDLEKILEIALEVSPKHHFTHIQFPFNLIEIGALEKYGEYGNLSLIEIAKMNNLITMSNRPLNAFTQGQLVRLASYENEVSTIDHNYAKEVYTKAMSSLELKWIEEHQKANESEIEDIREVSLIKQFIEIWDKLPGTDSVDQVYHGYLFPFIANVWGGSLSPEDSSPFYELYEQSLKFSRLEMHKKAMNFRDQAISVGLIENISTKDFTKEVLNSYLSYGIDYVLVGMKKPEYVGQLKELF